MSRRRRLVQPGHRRIVAPRKTYERRVQTLVQSAHNAMQRLYRSVCLGQGTTDARGAVDEAISALSRVRARLLLDGIEAGSKSFRDFQT